MGKLDGIPKIVYINMNSAVERNEHIIKNFSDYGITKYQRFAGLVARKSMNKKLRKTEYGCMMSHLKIIKEFYSSGEDQLIIMEDDIDVSSIDNWDFTWKELMEALPEFEVLQLIRNRNIEDHAKLKVWDLEDKGTGAYLITRGYAKKIIDIHKKDPINLYSFPDVTERRGPVADFALYSGFNCLSISIFKQVLFDSQVSSCALPEWVKNWHNVNEKFWSKKHSLDEIVGKE